MAIRFNKEIFQKLGLKDITDPDEQKGLTPFYKTQEITQRLNLQNDMETLGYFSAGELFALDLLNEAYGKIIEEYFAQSEPGQQQSFLDHIANKYRDETIQELFREYIDSIRTSKKKDFKPEQLLNEILMLKLNLSNPALKKIKPLISSEALQIDPYFSIIFEEMKKYFGELDNKPPFHIPLVDLLESPYKSNPSSLHEQLTWMKDHWQDHLGDLNFYIFQSMDILSEENKIRGEGPGEAEIIRFSESGEEHSFTPDSEWMPNVIILAKNAMVWLHQLSEKYSCHISCLDQIPDEELDELSQNGFTALWLIGIWKRSPASRKIKRLCGDPDAESSAYALWDYEISSVFGGEKALDDLLKRCAERNIRLACDMVPNHMGIDSKWVQERADWFIQSDEPPFPTYTFNGEDLSDNPEFGIYIEDHYYSRSDAAVVYKLVENETGKIRYIYHGNDGTSMPWNDTAQLNYLLKDVREAVIQTIIDLAGRFSIIRFDAAMTLAKRHFHRLWYPEPGTGSDIASRALHGMTRNEFDKLFPKEFWREVVDRMKTDAPDTLLLAEAFWMMEGYFVQTLGMHRVYNSAFMNMLKMEDNAGYRQSIKNTLEYDPRILERYVNFLNNPDEDPAIIQFGKEDKYFAITTLMITMPGTPLFGHGQIEGFTEKYGMEFSKSKMAEKADPLLVDRHHKEVFPLLQKRRLFSESKNFLLFDFIDESGIVNENVFAYFNSRGRDRVLIFINNSYDTVTGSIQLSVPYRVFPDSNNSQIETTELYKAIGVNDNRSGHVIFRNFISDKTFSVPSSQIRSERFGITLRGYDYKVFFIEY